MKLEAICKFGLNGIHKISNIFSWISGIALIIMAILTFVDVVGRYVFNFPIKGTQEIVELLMVITLYYGMAYATYKRNHITVDAVIVLFPKYIQDICLGICSILCLFVSAPAAWMMTLKGIEIFGQSNISTGTLNIPLYPFYLMAALGCTFLSIEFLLDGILRFIEAYQKKRNKGTVNQTQIAEKG